MSDVILQGISADELAEKIISRIQPPPPAGSNPLTVPMDRQQIQTAMLMSRDKFDRVRAAKNIQHVGKRGHAKLYTLSQFLELPDTVA